MQQKKCKIDGRDAVGNTPIHLAALVGHQRYCCCLVTCEMQY